MTMALELAISYGKKDMGLTKIIAITTIQNHKAIQLLERLNFVKIYANSSNNEIMYEWHMNDEIIVE
jgi:ribosomal-protein-alanine N-acetyltransferase